MRRTRPDHSLLPLALALLCLNLPQAVNLQAAEPEASNPAGIRGEVLGQLREAESKLIEIAGASSASAFTWRPGKGVRSMGEVLTHVAGSNDYYPSLWGAKPPAGVNGASIERLATDRDKAIAATKASFAYLREQILALSDADLDRVVDMFGTKLTVRGLLLHITVHAHEHLGQTIAYARMKGIVPPWSKPGD
jgi:uncharacterized damage-inducible protein DinB